MAHVSDEKKQVVKDFAKLIEEYPIIAAVNMENLPAKQLQKMRANLRDKVVLQMTKRRLLHHALEEADKKKPGVLQLKPYLKGMPALLFTKDNPFALYKTLKKSMSKAPLKGGQKAPSDIVVPAGPTKFAPGPIISELAGLGMKTGIQDGKVAIKADSLVAKEGQVVSQALASALARLGIEPVDIGLDLVAAYENGIILTKDVLDVDEKAFLGKVSQAVSEATNLSFTIAYPTKETIELLLRSAAADALVLGVEKNIPADETLKLIVAKAAAQAEAISALVPDAK